ncbi:hypothetical protein PG993_003153 [Apiospora rasikravindrae]|uniref:F-box domain-containing protein n=1 Tax=Apiospora rasikravindrae TaxID=990691 RepID=A0ABR1U1D5_9PEZI
MVQLRKEATTEARVPWLSTLQIQPPLFYSRHQNQEQPNLTSAKPPISRAQKMSIQLPELVSIIVDQLHDDGDGPLASYASISPVWQHAVERHTFADLEVCNTEISDFIDIFSKYQTRRNYLRRLGVLFRFPKAVVTNDQQSRNQQIFQSAITLLLRALKQWEDQSDVASSKTATSLILALSCEDVIYFRGAECLLELSNDGHVPDLPKLRSVGTFIDSFQPEYSLRSLTFQLVEAAIPLQEDRLKYRLDFACGLDSLCGTLPLLEEFSIMTGRPDVSDHPQLHRPDFTDGEGFDPLCEAIRRLTQPTVRVLMVGGIVITADLFTNRRPHATSDNDMWKSLEEIVVRTTVMDSTGRWYLGDEAPIDRGLGSFLEDYTDAIFDKMPYM